MKPSIRQYKELLKAIEKQNEQKYRKIAKTSHMHDKPEHVVSFDNVVLSSTSDMGKC